MTFWFKTYELVFVKVVRKSRLHHYAYDGWLNFWVLHFISISLLCIKLKCKKALKKLDSLLVVEASDFRTTFTKTSSHFKNKNVMSQESHNWHENYHGSIFLLKVFKNTDSHIKPLSLMFQAPSGRHQLPVCLCERMWVSFIVWVHAWALKILIVLFQETQFAIKNREATNHFLTYLQMSRYIWNNLLF